MKKTKIIIPAIGLLLLSTAASVSGTVAWLSMNTSVTATGMQVKAKADQVYLQIVNSATAFSNTESQNTAAATSASKEIAASNVVKSNETSSVVTFDGTTAVWVTNVSNTPGTATPTGNYVTLDTAGSGDIALANYALINSFKIRLNPSTGVATANDPLKATGVSFTASASSEPMRNAVSVLVTSTEGEPGSEVTHYQLFKQLDGNATTQGNGTFTPVVSNATNKLTAANFTNPTAGYTEVKVYVFLDGDNAAMYTNNIVLDSGYTVQVAFSVDYV